MSQEYLLHVRCANDIPWKATFLHKAPSLYVTICVDDTIQRSKVVKHSTIPVWDEDLMLLSKDPSSVVFITIQRSKSLARDMHVGKVDIEISALLRLCENNQDATLKLKPIDDVFDDRDLGTITVRLTAVEGPKAGAIVIGNVQGDIKLGEIDHPAVTESATYRVLDAGVAAGAQQSVLNSLSGVMSKLDLFVQFVDKAAKVHPYATFAWHVTSSLYKAVKGQLDRDAQLVGLVKTMEDVYSFVDATESFRNKVKVLEKIIGEILKQTVECAIFIREYTGHGFGRRLVTQTFADSRQKKISEFSQAFVLLRQALDSGNIIQAVFISTRTLEEVEKLVKIENLKLLNPVQMDASLRPECLHGTREDILATVTNWLITPLEGQNVLWLHGVAGFGKSTIATTIADYFREVHRLGAFIFFDRNDKAHSDPAAFVRTLTYQLALFDSHIQSTVSAAIEDDKRIAEALIRRQFANLLLGPLEAIAKLPMQGPVIVVIDALDECGEAASRKSLLTLLTQELAKLPPMFRFLITGRAESDISAAFSGQSHILKIELSITTDANANDVSLFLQSEMGPIRDCRNLAPDWPGKDRVDKLAKRSAGLFIWASLAVNLIMEAFDPDEQLEVLLRGGSQGTAEAVLDALYTTVLCAAGKWDTGASSTFHAIMGIVIAGRVPLSDDVIDRLLGLDGHMSSKTMLLRLQCLLIWNPGKPVWVLHASFADYLTDQHRSGQQPWFIDLAAANTNLALACLRLMKTGLHFNICGLETSHLRNEDVPGLARRIETAIPSHLAYACRFWADHLCAATGDNGLTGALHDFVHESLLYWLEALSLLDKVVLASPSLLKAARWSRSNDVDPNLIGLVTETSRFVANFREPMSYSTPHLYISLLPFSPVGSLLSKEFLRQFPRTLALQDGAIVNWPAHLQTLEGHTDPVRCVTFSPDGKLLASGSDDCKILIWDTETGDVVRGPLDGHTSDVNSVAFSPDGKYIASGSDDQTIRVWNLEMGDVARGPWKGHTVSVNSVIFSPDGNYIASGSADKTILVWDAVSGDVVAGPFKGHTDYVYSIAFSPDGKLIASGSGDNTIRVWDASNGDVIAGPFRGHSRDVYSVAFSPDNKHIASAGDSTIWVWDASNGDVIAGPFRGHSHFVFCVAFSPDGKHIASGSSDKTIRVWNARNGKVVAGPFEGHSGWVHAVAFSPDGKHIASGSHDRTIRVWDVAIDVVVAEPFKGHSDWVWSVTFSPDSKYIASASQDKTVRVWDAEYGNPVSRPLVGHTGGVLAVAFSPDGTRLVTGGDDCTIMIWDTKSSNIITEPSTGHMERVRSVAFSPDGRHIVSGSEDTTIRVWDANSGKRIAEPLEGHTGFVWSVVFSPDGKHIASGSQDNTIRVWDAETGNFIAELSERQGRKVYTVAFSPNGRYIASGLSHSMIQIWDGESGNVIAEPLEGHNQVCAVVFSPDGRHIVSGSDDGTVRVWDAKTGNVIRVFKGHTDCVGSVAFAPDGKHIASGSSDHTIRVWDMATSDRASALVKSPNAILHTNDTPSETTTDLDTPMQNWSWGEDGWIVGPNLELMFWVPLWHRAGCQWPKNTAIMAQNVTKFDFSKFVHGTDWQLCRMQS